jgi:hypothetical protein
VNLKKVETKKEENVKRGKRAKRKGAQFERDIAKKFQKRYGVELKRTPQSGGFAKKSDKADDFRGDVTIVDNKQVLLLHLECKNQQTWQLKQWLNQAESDCPKDRTPVVVFHRHGFNLDYVVLSLRNFISIIDERNCEKYAC